MKKGTKNHVDNLFSTYLAVQMASRKFPKMRTCVHVIEGSEADEAAALEGTKTFALSPRCRCGFQHFIRRSSRSDGLANCGNYKLRNISNFEGMLCIFLVELQQQVEVLGSKSGAVHNRHQATVHRGCPIAPAQAKGIGWKDMLGVQHA